ncbi:MAG TPA: PA domain-containing protein [Candidatus Polarisedimenticolaceae bacterium]|nr:PA domain-containing protein [Candidatus Polarisedimenticolaceae bacterium]
MEIIGDDASGTLSTIESHAGITVEDKATAYLQFAAKQDPVEAHNTLNRVLELGLEVQGTDKAQRLLASTYTQLALLHEGEPSRQAYLLGKALEQTEPQAMRQMLEARIVELGGNDDPATQFAYQPPATTDVSTPRNFGTDDSCTGAPAVGVPSIIPMDIANPIGSFRDRNFLEVVIPGPLGMALEIETTSPNCNSDATCSATAYDTDMNLWGSCTNNFEGNLVERDINAGDGGVGWLSKIQTDCLLPGSYYLEVKGQFGSAPKDFDVEIRQIGSCVVPVPDSYESDNAISEGADIGFSTSSPTQANAWGRQRSEIQGRSIFPPNDDDHAIIKLNDQTTRVQMGSQVQFGSVWNGGVSIPSGPDEDSQIILFYGEDPHGGICNSAPLVIPNNYCKSSGDCDPDATPADPTQPASTCIPLWQLRVPGEARSRWQPDNALAFNDDVNPASNLGSALDICLPRTQPGGPSLALNGGGFAIRSRGWRPPFPGSVSGLAYDYEVSSRNNGPCLYESEPNQSFPDATPIVANTPVNGTWEGSETYPLFDVDIWGPFDVQSPGEEVTIEVFPELLNGLIAKATIELWAYPDDNGNAHQVMTIDTGSAPDARVNLDVQNADDFLGNTMADAGYYVVVSSSTAVPNWYYTLRVITPRVDAVDIEPNDFVAQPVDYRGNTFVVAEISEVCDIDRFSFTVPESQFLDMTTTDPGTDTVMSFERVQPDAFEFFVTAPAALAGPYAFGSSAYTGYVPATSDNYNGEVVEANDGTGVTWDACEPLVNAAAISGKVCLVTRGTCAFTQKNLMCQAAGASATLVRNTAAAPIVMGGDCGGLCEIPQLSVGIADGDLIRANLPGVFVRANNKEFLACDDDGRTFGSNQFLSQITGCVPPGDYIISVRGWNTSTGPYVLNFNGAAGCTPTEPPSMNDTGTGSSQFCPPNFPFARFCQ